ncbi:hypothetical protein [Methylobacterium sp. NFXW15]|uniref:hypothetical protein n=1 Tax=Methylobacterium sp. NFXW15 TaxID=2819512 RepID=UPI003CE98942
MNMKSMAAALSHSDTLNERDLGSVPTATTSVFTPLKLPAQSGKHTPPGFLGLHLVLDEVGRRMSPVEWGRLPGWDLLPFRYDSRRKVYRAKWGLRLVKDAPILRSSPVATEVKRTDLRACARLYRTVCDRVIAEFEAGRLVAYALHRPWGNVEEITTPGIWAVQSEWAFYAGLIVVPGQFGKPVTARVLVKHDDLGRWGRKQDEKGTKKKQAEARRRIGRAIRDFMEKTGIRLTKKNVLELLESALGKEALQPKVVFMEVWGEIPTSQGGRPENAAKAGVDNHRDNLLALIRAAWTSDQAIPSGL